MTDLERSGSNGSMTFGGDTINANRICKCLEGQRSIEKILNERRKHLEKTDLPPEKIDEMLEAQRSVSEKRRDDLDEFCRTLKKIGQLIKEDGKLVIKQCNTGAGANGARLVHCLSKLLDRDVEAPSGEILIKRNRWWKRLGPPDPDDITIEPQEGSEWQRGEPDQKKPPKKKQAPSGSSKKGWIPFMPDETAYRHPGSPESPPTSNPSNPTRTTTRTVATVTGEEQMEIPIGTPDYTNRRITGEESGMDHVSIGVGVGTHSGSGSSSGEENQQTEGQNR